jgi:uncharacterized membrane protein
MLTAPGSIDRSSGHRGRNQEPRTAASAGPRDAHGNVPNAGDHPAELSLRNVQTIADLEAVASSGRTRSDRMADAIAGFCGSMPFVWVHAAWFGFWLTINVVPGMRHVDPFPFPLLTLVTSLEAIFLTTFVMISQNHLGKLADRRNHLDLQINLLAEQENSKTLSMLGTIMRHMGITHADSEITALSAATQPEVLVEQIQQTIEQSDETEKDSSKVTPPLGNRRPV